MYKIAFEKEVKKEFLKLDPKAQKLVAAKILDLQKGNFSNDKPLIRKRVGNYRIIYLKEGDHLLITIIRIAHRKEAY